MEPVDLEKMIGEMEVGVERLRSLYDQYFMGIEKIEPTVAKKDIERRIYVLRKEQIRNTALRFRFQMALQRYNTFQTYWQRMCREIENGTYKRHLNKAERRFGNAARGRPSAPPPPLDPSSQAPEMPIAPDLPRVPSGPGAPPPHGSAQAPGLAPHISISAQPLAFAPHISAQPPPLPRQAQALSGQPPAGLGRPIGAPPPVLPGRSTGPTTSVRSGALPVAPERGNPVPGAALPAHLASELAELDLDFAPPPSAQPSVLRPRPLGPASAASPASRLGPTSEGQDAVPPGRQAVPPSAPRQGAPPSPARRAEPAPTARAVQPPAQRRDDELSDDRVRQLYVEYVAAKRRQNESTAAITYDAVAQSLRDSSEKLRKKHGKAIDFEVATRDGKAILKPVLK